MTIRSRKIETTVVNILKTRRYDVYIGRPNSLGNPFEIGTHGTREQVVQYHWEWLNGIREAPDGRKPPTRGEIIQRCKGKKLGCFCAPELYHGDNYVRICDGE